ncbi:hypothetical protein GCM10022393_04100 [Aquimarina addita]|uniref:DUF2911 domain-containing protein n=1 Tax=Aquimarina addita TaxID=870485 RepID=A0ABP7X9S5_9FLAO
MKKSFLLVIIMIASSLTTINAQKFADLQKSPTDIAYARSERSAKPDIKVVYSRPQKKDRKIFGELVPYDKVWRTGADEATEIKFFKDVKLGEKSIPAGTYSLFTIPGEKEWTVIISSVTDVWGAYDYDESNDVARFKVAPSTGKEVEAFSIAFEKVDAGYHMKLGWDTTIVAVPFML